MAIIQCIPTQCKADLLQGIHDLSEDVLMIALYAEGADLGPDTVHYTTDGEVSGTGYTAGGKDLEGMAIQMSSGSAWVTWDNVSWAGADFYASGAMVYNANAEDKAIMVLSFGMPRLFSSTSNTITFPASTASTALMRLT